MTNKNAYAQSGVDVEAGYEVVERIKNMWLVRSVRVSWELLVVSVACLTFQKQVLKSLFDLRYRWCWYQVDAGY